ncbi:DUF2147 domain-containing protein [Acinetobacter rongchengensis]|uniref:DUF2147 domain-containing protein n=1 Tax=Acinetobacter rongchengensis TaxID=2419601 RepID=A0A3A8FB59_9GAMM|nr:DUF2147 domain-containing protein [Acinetobacter rongchengensis]RKG38431.1 DUF2147 domain-containing protein [Acinetobacter rongchengensis]
MWSNRFILGVLFSVLSCGSMAKDITGIWKNIDDKTGSSKAVLEVRKEANGTYTGKIIKITPLPGYTPKETCVNCPAPYTNKPILGMDVLKNLVQTSEENYSGGKIIDPLSGKIYSMKAKLSANGNRLSLRGYIGVSALGRSQIWIREN